MAQDLFMTGLRHRNPSASECELLALWTERCYRSVAPELLAKSVAAIRARGAAGTDAAGEAEAPKTQ